MQKSTLQKNHLVVKQNALNEVRPAGMGLQELRFFSIYLSKINPKDEKTRVVRFPLSDFQAIMELGRIDTKKLKNVIDGLLTKLTGTVTPTGGFARFQIFKKCVVDKDESGEWCVEIDAHDDALPLMFDFKSHYFKYELWNALRLKSKNQLRMYEILKQYEKVGSRIMSVKELREQLGIEESEYPQFERFRTRVLDSCQEALAEYTDISYTYEPYGKKGRGGKVLQLKFTIIKNEDFVDPLSLNKFIEINNTEEFHDIIDADAIDENGLLLSTGTSPIYEERIAFLMEACNNRFSREEIMVLYGVMQQKVPHIHSDGNRSHDYLQQKYREMMMNDKKGGVSSKFNYMKKLVASGEG